MYNKHTSLTLQIHVKFFVSFIGLGLDEGISQIWIMSQLISALKLGTIDYTITYA